VLDNIVLFLHSILRRLH